MRKHFVALLVTAACLRFGLGCGVEPPDVTALDDPGDDVAGRSGGDAGTGTANDSGMIIDASPLIVGAQVTGLLGQGLVLRTSMGQLIEITADGTVTLAPPVPTGGAAVTVVSQPVNPSQVCTGAIGTSGMVTVSCATNGYKLGGTVTNLLGTDLVLESQAGERLAVTQNGDFQFAGPVADGSTYSVRIATQPNDPRQVCVVSHGVGRVEGHDVTKPLVNCTTSKFRVGGEVLGLTGGGILLALEGGEQKAIASDGAFSFSPLPDGTPFSVVIAQASTGNQECHVVQGKGVLSGQDIDDVTVVCGSLGNLRISEVGSCYYVDSACWVEITNVGDKVENLGAHTLRTTARRLSTKEGSHTFTLPDHPVRPGDYVVVRARSTQALPDGGGTVHISHDGTLPWWDNSGFVELLSITGTEDFVRFGSNTARAVSPFDALLWDAGEVEAPTLPGAELGRSLARDLKVSDTGTGKDWVLRTFATPGGPNDVSSDADADQDGVPDVSEVPGGKFAGLDLYAMGARTGQRDLFIEIDHMDSADPAVVPRKEALDKLVSTFALRRIALHLDVGGLYAASFSPQQHNLGGGNVVPFSKTVGINVSDPNVSADVYRYKAEHMAAARRSIFYYMLFGSSQQADGAGGSSGVGEVSGNDSIITLGGYSLNDADPLSLNVLINLQALTMMHELGHNLGLSHGGGDRLNGKPNYISVMNYLYSLGLPTVGTSAEGDRYDLEVYCTLKYLNQLSNPPTGEPSRFVIDYSDGLSADINEASIDESDGLGRLDSVAVDFNCNKKIDGAPYARDVNFDGRSGDILSDYDDWSKLHPIFRRTRAGSETVAYFPEVGVRVEAEDDLLTDDMQAVVEQPCPKMRIP